MTSRPSWAFWKWSLYGSRTFGSHISDRSFLIFQLSGSRRWSYLRNLTLQPVLKGKVAEKGTMTEIALRYRTLLTLGTCLYFSLFVCSVIVLVMFGLSAYLPDYAARFLDVAGPAIAIGAVIFGSLMLHRHHRLRRSLKHFFQDVVLAAPTADR